MDLEELVALDQTHLFRFLHCLLLLRQARTSTVTKAKLASAPRTMTITDIEKAGEEETTVGGRTRGVCLGLGGSDFSADRRLWSVSHSG